MIDIFVLALVAHVVDILALLELVAHVVDVSVPVLVAHVIDVLVLEVVAHIDVLFWYLYSRNWRFGLCTRLLLAHVIAVFSTV